MRAFVRDEVKPVTLHPRRLEPFEKPLLADLLTAACNMGLRHTGPPATTRRGQRAYARA